ncbi:MAG: hypothetical protein J6Y21_08800, partial [Clostridia bacterium]|nr:hypothetical protein [Clostridia bacterium]
MTRKINLNMVKKLGAIALAGMLVLTGCARSDPEDEGNNMNSLFLNSKFDESTEELTGWTTWSSNELAVFSVAKKAGP